MDPLEFTGRAPTSHPSAFFQLCQPFGRIVILQQLEQELIPRPSTGLARLELLQNP